MKRLLVVAAVAVLGLTLLTGCGSSGPSITVYNAQHEELLKAVIPTFTKDTGIEVKLRNGEDLELANQLVQEGKASPADVFLTENSPGMSLVDKAGLFAPIEPSTRALIPSRYQPADHDWTGFIARSTVVVYNPSMISKAQLPSSIMDFAKPQWKDKIAFSPTGADFQAIVSAVLATKGEQATAAWVKGIAANGKTYQGNNVVLDAVNSGEVPAGIIYHYYWYRDQAESGEHSDNTRLAFFGNQDPGAFVSVSGAGVLKSSSHPKEAQEFVHFLASKKGQQLIADSYALEYPLNPKVSLGQGVKPFSSLEPPKVELSALNSQKVIDLMQQAGLL
ncbi:MAG: iron ABC transporter substrate-binding protein [Marmoricola sp.]